MMKNILVIGAGRFGGYLCQKLNELDHDVMLVDTHEERINSLLPYVTNAEIGDATNEDFLKSLGVKNFDLCYVAIGDNFMSSLEATSLLKDLGATMVIARASSESQEKLLYRIGADHVVFPEKQQARWAAIRFSSQNISNYIEVSDDYGIFEIEVQESWVLRTIEEIALRKRYGFNVLGIRNGSLNMDVGPDTVLHEGEKILVLGNRKKIKEVFRL